MGKKGAADGEWTTVIEAKNNWLDLNVREWWRYRDLILLFVKRNFTVVYKQTILGPLWAILQPLLTTVIFTVVFGGIAKLPTDGVPPFLFYMCGNVAWNYFASCLNGTSKTFIDNSRVFGKVYFPRMAVPIATVLTNLITFLIQFVFFLCFLAYYATRPDSGIRVDWPLAALCLVGLAQMAMLGLGFGVIVSALTTKYRDLQMLVSFGVQLWLYATPVTYASTMIPAKYLALYRLNPMTPVIELFRAAFLGAGSFDPVSYAISLGTTVLVLLVGLVLFNRIEKTFMDTV